MAHPVPQLARPLKLLPLDYDPEIPVALLHQMERLCKGAGVPLVQIELLGQDANVCQDFIQLATSVTVQAALLTTDWLLLEARWQVRNQN